jgi:pimeloyl-ACP methyl ester carboxylesterase
VEVDRVARPLVLLPGLLLDARLWQPQVEGLAGRVTPWVADLTRDDSIAGMARRVLAEAPFERFALCALSMGGYVALEIMRQAPQRVERLALLDTQAIPEADQARERRLAQIRLVEGGKLGLMVERLLPLELSGPRLEDANLRVLRKAMALDVGPEGFLRQVKAIMGRPDSRPTLGTIRCPTLVLCGEHDALTPRVRHEEMAAAVPGAILRIVPGCGHLSTLEKPLEVNSALAAWLDASSPSD